MEDLRPETLCLLAIDGRPLAGPMDCLPDMDMRDIGSVCVAGVLRVVQAIV
jgi:hypothetical protein